MDEGSAAHRFTRGMYPTITVCGTLCKCIVLGKSRVKGDRDGRSLIN